MGLSFLTRAVDPGSPKRLREQKSGPLVGCDHFFDENLEIAGGTLLLAGASQINGSLKFTGGTLDGSGDLSLNGGAIWKPVNSGLDRNASGLDLAIDPSAPETLYLSTQGFGVFKTG